MNVVVYGVAFANYAWTQTYQLAMGETVPNQSEINQLTEYDMLPLGLSNTWISSAYGDTDSITFDNNKRCISGTQTYVTATDLFAMATCTELAKKSAEESGTTASYMQVNQMPGTPVDERLCDPNDDTNYFICFGNAASTDAPATACGSIKFDSESKFSAIGSAVQEAMGLAQNYAALAYQGTFADADGLTTDGTAYFDCSGVQNMANNPRWPDSYIDYGTGICAVQSDIASIAMKYAQGLLSTFQDTSDQDTTSSDDNYKTGWATAGQYFQTLSLNIAAGEIGPSASTGDATGEAKTLLANRGTLAAYNFNGMDANTNTSATNTGGTNTGGSSLCDTNANIPNSPACIKQCLCFSISGDSSNENVNYFYASVLPYYGNSTSTYGYYSGAASAVFAQQAASINDESQDQSSTPIAESTATVQSQAACNIAQNVIAASNDIGNDMPSYLTSSNVMNPGNLGSISSGASDQDTQFGIVGKDSITYQKTDFATTNMMLSVNMTLQALTGMKMFSSTVNSVSSYMSLSDGNNICPKCGEISAYANNCSSDEAGKFINNLFANNLLLMGNNVDTADTTRAGLFGMTYIQDAGWTHFADPLANLTNLGVTMISAAVFYYTATMQQLFSAILQISLTYTGIVAAAKLILAGTNAYTSGMAEPIFVATGALVEGFFQMLFALDKFALELFIPLGTAVAGILFTQGVVLGVFLPFLATIIFLFGVLGWLFSVVEAMVASSLVAMGLTHPEGHDLLGQTEQALMLLLGVFVRPVTMILGLFFAISVSQATLNLVNTGFLFVTSDYFNATMQAGAAGTNVGSVYSKVVSVSTIGILLVYTYICYSILEMCYGLISQIPDRILRWIKRT